MGVDALDVLLELDDVVVVGGGVLDDELDDDELELDEPDDDELEPLEESSGSGSREPGGLVRSRELELPLEPSLEPSSLVSLPLDPPLPEPVDDEPRDELPLLQPLADAAPPNATPPSATTSASRTNRPQEGITVIMVHPHWPAPAAAVRGRPASTTPCGPRERE